MKPIRALVRWIPASKGGRKRPPPGPNYLTIARFEDERDRWPHEAWSLRVDFIKQLGKSTLVATVRFLSSDAPWHVLRPGARFELCEGKRVVAKGVALSAKLKIPASINTFELALLGTP